MTPLRSIMIDHNPDELSVRRAVTVAAAEGGFANDCHGFSGCANQRVCLRWIKPLWPGRS